jgi:hypothetical protein
VMRACAWMTSIAYRKTCVCSISPCVSPSYTYIYFIVDALVQVHPISFLYFHVGFGTDVGGFVAVDVSIGMASSQSPEPPPIPLVMSPGPNRESPPLGECDLSCVIFVSVLVDV